MHKILTSEVNLRYEGDVSLFAKFLYLPHTPLKSSLGLLEW